LRHWCGLRIWRFDQARGHQQGSSSQNTTTLKTAHETFLFSVGGKDAGFNFSSGYG